MKCSMPTPSAVPDLRGLSRTLIRGNPAKNYWTLNQVQNDRIERMSVSKR